MRTFLNILFLIMFVVCKSQTPSSNQNYIKTSTYKEPSMSVDDSKAQVNVTYFDGIGRPVQIVSGKMSGEGKDMTTHVAYDGFGRKVQDFLPYAKETDNLAFDDQAEYNSFDFYNKPEFQNSSNPYSEMFMELSPLNRVIKQAAPGDKWKADVSNNDNTIKYAYLLNSDNDAVRKLTATAAWNPTTKIYDVTFNTNSGANYPAGVLYKTITQNENKVGPVYTSTALASKINTTEEYKNKEGQVVLKRTFNWLRGAPSPEILNTYYIYDQFGNLAFVSSPIANGSNSTTNLNNHTYHYKYDDRNRLVEKKLPGKQWEYLVYDNQDRVVAVGPMLSPFGSPTALPEDTPEQGWLLTRYDIFGRVAYTGWQSTALTGFSSTVRNTMQNSLVEIVQKKNPPLNIDSVPVSYTDVLPQTTKLLTVNYYDDYNFSGAPTTFPTVEGQTIITNCKGLITGSWVRTLSSSSIIGETSYTFYDDKSRPVRTYTTNYLGGYTYVDSKLDFDGSVLYTIKRHKRLSTDGILTVREDFSYTPQDRLSGHSHKINSLTPQTLASLTYNKIGQVTQKRVGTTTGTFSGPLQYVDYKYNIRGWLTDINDVANLSVGGQMTDQFAFKINYDSPTQGSTPLFNGNISETFWISGSDNILRKYVYQYDNLNRMTYAFYEKPDEAVINTNSYNEALTYDKNGNILTLRRNGGLDDPQTVVEIDNLSYIYNGNQLKNVYDASNSPQGFKDGTNAGDDFKYDGNGNMKIDANKGISSITYNFQNLPTEIVFDNNTSKKINYLYNANGVKLKKTVTDGTNVMVVEYLDGFQYKGSILQFFPTAEGYVDNTRVGGANNFSYVYQYKDHLGNVRMDYGFRPGRTQWDLGEIVVKEESHYYPFGLKHMNYNMDYLEYQDQGGDIVLAPPPITPSGKLANNYKYQGQERQDELGLNWDLFKWRNYDYAIGRFMCIDPLTEKYNTWSPYAFSGNRVIDSRELEGLEPVKVNEGVDNLVIVALGRAGGMNGDGITNGKTLFSALEKNGFSDKGLNQLSRMSIAKDATVITYAGSDGTLTAEHIATTIANYRETNPNGTVSLIGHSLGGKSVLEAANLVYKNDDIKNKTINLVMTLEAASTKGLRGSAYDGYLFSNVINVINIDSAKSDYSGGGGHAAASSNETTIKLPTGTNHTNMDNTVAPVIPSMLKYMYGGGNPTLYSNDTFKDKPIVPNDEGGGSSY